MSETEKAEAKTEREKALEAKELELKAINDKRTGKGTRLRVGQTRGKNPQIVVWEAFNESEPATLPSTVAEFITLSGLESISKPAEQEAKMLEYLIEGFNADQYVLASDPIAEYVEASWSDEVQKNFRMVVRNYTQAMQSVNKDYSVDDAVKAIKPQFEAGLKKA